MIRPLIVCIIIILAVTSFGNCQQLDEYIDFKGLNSLGNDWKVIRQNITSNEGYVKLHHESWLMYFLHWRPLTEENKNVNLLYTRYKLLNFWGAAMNFSLKETEGIMNINGHKAFYVDGSFGGFVETRFIIWNCPETKRQFIADLNINTRLETPGFLHELQQLITKTIFCHGNTNNNINKNRYLTKKYQSEEYSLSFFLPQNWKTIKFSSKKWFPNGLTGTNGTLLSLLTDSQKHMELMWKKTKENISEKLFGDFLKYMESHSPVRKDSSRCFDFTVLSKKLSKGLFIADGTFKLGSFKNTVKDYSENFQFRGFLWKNGDTAYLVIPSLVNVNNVWNMPADVSHTQGVFEHYIKNEINPYIKIPSFYILNQIKPHYE